MTSINEGDWIRYTDDFCEQTSTTLMGLTDMATRRGKVTQVFNGGRLCNVDWGDCMVQFETDSRSIVLAEAPYACVGTDVEFEDEGCPHAP